MAYFEQVHCGGGGGVDNHANHEFIIIIILVALLPSIVLVITNPSSSDPTDEFSWDLLFWWTEYGIDGCEGCDAPGHDGRRRPHPAMWMRMRTQRLKRI